jgi:hypothetical protein
MPKRFAQKGFKIEATTSLNALLPQTSNNFFSARRLGQPVSFFGFYHLDVLILVLGNNLPDIYDTEPALRSRVEKVLLLIIAPSTILKR